MTIDLPDSFEFRRYGTDYTRLSVCSNGWVAPGTTTNAAYANTPLPNSSMPGGMIAANWDDLYPPTGNGVWCHYDSVFDWLVVEWDSVAYYGNPTLPDKFEIVILGRSHPSPSEDNSIRLQYLTAFGFYSSTIGVQNLSSSNAIQLCFNDDYARTAAPIVPGRAIQFEEAWQVPVAEQRHDVMSQPELWVGPSLFRDRLLIRLSGRWQGNVSLKVYNTAGQAVATLLDQLQKPGRYTLTWDGRDNNERTLSSGVYFVALEAAGRRLKQKVVLASRGE
jgi:hypothetical protein